MLSAKRVNSLIVNEKPSKIKLLEARNFDNPQILTSLPCKKRCFKSFVRIQMQCQIYVTL